MRLIILLLLLANVALGDGVLGITNNTTTLGAGPSSGPQLWGTNAVDGSIYPLNAGPGTINIDLNGSIQGANAIHFNNQLIEDSTPRTIYDSGSGVMTAASFDGVGSLLTSLNASQLTSGVIPDQVRYPLTNFTTYAAGTAYTLTGSSAALDFGTTDPVLTINQAGTYLIHANVGVKYSGATYVAPQTVTFKLRRTNNTAADLTNGSRAVELPVLTTFTGGDTFSLPPIIYAATSGDSVTIFGILSATPGAGSVLADSAEILALRLY